MKNSNLTWNPFICIIHIYAATKCNKKFTLNSKFCQTWYSVRNDWAEILPQMVNSAMSWMEEFSSSTTPSFSGFSFVLSKPFINCFYFLHWSRSYCKLQPTSIQTKLLCSFSFNLLLKMKIIDEERRATLSCLITLIEYICLVAVVASIKSSCEGIMSRFALHTTLASLGLTWE